MKGNPTSDKATPSSAEPSFPHRVAYARVILPSGEVLKREVVEFDGKGTVLTHYPLREEQPFTEWQNTTYFIRA